MIIMCGVKLLIGCQLMFFVIGGCSGEPVYNRNLKVLYRGLYT